MTVTLPFMEPEAGSIRLVRKVRRPLSLAPVASLLPVLVVSTTARRAAAITAVSDTTLPLGTNYCTTSGSHATVLSVSVLTQYQLEACGFDSWREPTTGGGNNNAVLVSNLRVAGSTFDNVNHGGKFGTDTDIKDFNSALTTTTTTTSGTIDVTLWRAEVGDTVCLYQGMSDLQVIY